TQTHFFVCVLKRVNPKHLIITVTFVEVKAYKTVWWHHVRKQSVLWIHDSLGLSCGRIPKNDGRVRIQRIVNGTEYTVA
ncbi:hypothetical protein VIGAN_01104700, partial [Vigna angularis var. angularis]